MSRRCGEPSSQRREPAEAPGAGWGPRCRKPPCHASALPCHTWPLDAPWALRWRETAEFGIFERLSGAAGSPLAAKRLVVGKGLALRSRRSSEFGRFAPSSAVGPDAAASRARRPPPSSPSHPAAPRIPPHPGPRPLALRDPPSRRTAPRLAPPRPSRRATWRARIGADASSSGRVSGVSG